MSHFMPPALLALFAPRPAVIYKPPLKEKSKPKLTGIAQYVSHFVPKNELPEVKIFETPKMKKKKRIELNKKKHLQILEERLKNWDPHKNKNSTKNAYKTLFVARLSYELNEDDLKHEFNRYGPIRDVKLIYDNNGKSRGYAFIEFESDHDLKRAFKDANGLKLKGRRILVDVERGRTVPGWKPRKLGGGLGKTRASKKDKEKKKLKEAALKSKKHIDLTESNPISSSSGYRGSNPSNNISRHNNRERDRDYRDKDRRRYKDRDIIRDRKRSRSRDNIRGNGGRINRDDRDRGRDRYRDREKDRDRGRNRDNGGYNNNNYRDNRNNFRNNNNGMMNGPGIGMNMGGGGGGFRDDRRGGPGPGISGQGGPRDYDRRRDSGRDNFRDRHNRDGFRNNNDRMYHRR